MSETDKDDLREARRKLSYLQDNEERLIKRDGKEKYDKRVKQVKEVIAKLRGEKPKESQKSEYFDRTGYKPIYRMNEEEADKFISDAKKYLSENKDAKDVEQVQDAIRKVELRKEEIKETSNEEAEVYTRIKFEDVPNSGKINLKKYLSEKVRKGVDEKWSNIKNIPTENLKKMEKGLVNDLNKNFEAIKKSQRAELLYSIMKVKGELESRGKENKREQSSPKLYSGGKILGTKNEYSKNLNDVLNSENADSIVIPEHKLQGWHDTEDALAGTNWKVSREVDKNGNYELGGKYYIFHKKK